ELVRVHLLEEHDERMGGLLRHDKVLEERGLPRDERGNVRIHRYPRAECPIGVIPRQRLEEIRLIPKERTPGWDPERQHVKHEAAWPRERVGGLEDVVLV